MAKPIKKYSLLTTEQRSFIKKSLNIKSIKDIDVKILKDLKEKLKQLKDTRNKNMIIYKMWDVIMCTILASFADNNNWEDIHNFVEDNYDWFRTFLQMTGGIPTANSYERIIGLIDSKELEKILLDFFVCLVPTNNEKIKINAFDGRVNNGSKRNATITSNAKLPLNCLNVYSNEYGICISTTSIEDKTNEIPTVEKIVKDMNLTNTIVTWDALNTQKKNIEAVIDSHGDYIVPIKGNHELFHNELIEYFNETRCDEIKAGNLSSQYLCINEKSHGMVITYECYQTSDINWYENKDEWKGLKTFGLIKKTIQKKVKIKNTRKNASNKYIEKIETTVEKRYYICSRLVNINEFYESTRAHWSVENKIHWHLDFTFCQDKNSTTNKNALLNLEIIHKFVLGVLERVKVRYKKSLKGIRKHLSNNFSEFFPELLCYLALK